MIRRSRLAAVILVGVLLQTTLFTHLEVDGVAPWLLLVATLAVAYEDGPDQGALFGFVAGLAIDLFLATPLGLSALSYAVAGYGCGVLQGSMQRATPWAAPVVAAIGGFFGGFVFLAVGAVVGQDGFLSVAGFKTIIISAAYDAVVAPLIFPVVRWAARDPEHQATWRIRR